MTEISLFVEDDVHRRVVGALIERIARERGIAIQPVWRNAVGGYGRVAASLSRYFGRLRRQRESPPDLVVVATDSNCSGWNARVNALPRAGSLVLPFVVAVPDPHIERWLLLDGAAFRAAVGRGCDAPDNKCGRFEYKQRLARAVTAAGKEPALGGLEFAEAIVSNMDIQRAARDDRSFGRFIDDLDAAFRRLPP